MCEMKVYNQTSLYPCYVEKMLEPVRNILNKKIIIMASGSPSRKQLIEQIGLNVEYYTSTDEEYLEKYNTFPEYVEKIAEIKIQNVEEQLEKEGRSVDVIIGADTVVVIGDQIFGKPKTEEDIRTILRRLSGKTHVVYTGVVIKYNGTCNKFGAEAVVTFGHLTEDHINAYIASGEPWGKAGSYAIQGIGGTFVESITGEYSTLLGLPLHKFTSKLYELVKQETN